MQEIAIILSSLAGVATAAAVRRMPRGKRLLSLGASSHIKSQISSLKIEKDVLSKTISRLYQTDSEYSKIQKDKLLLKYQHQLGVVLARLEKLEQAEKHPDLGPVGDGLITLMDQKLSRLDDRLYEISSEMAAAKVQPKEPEAKKQGSKKPFNFVKPAEAKRKPVEIPAGPKQSFELTTLTSVSNVARQQTLGEPRQATPKTVPAGIMRPAKADGKTEIIRSMPEMKRQDVEKEFTKITEHKALPEPKAEQGPRESLPDDLDDDDDGLDKLKQDIMKTLSKLDQAEVE